MITRGGGEGGHEVCLYEPVVDSGYWTSLNVWVITRGVWERGHEVCLDQPVVDSG